MKNIIIGFFSVVILILLIYIFSATQGREVRKKELENALTNSMEIAIEMVMEDRQFAPKNNDELVAMLEQAIVLHLNSHFDTLTVNVVSVDHEKGLLYVEAILTYEHFSGGTGSVSVVKQIVMDQYQEAIDASRHTVTFMVNGDEYRKYTVEHGTICPIPPEPLTDNPFAGWEDSLTGDVYATVDLESLVIDEDYTLNAKLEY